MAGKWNDDKMKRYNAGFREGVEWVKKNYHTDERNRANVMGSKVSGFVEEIRARLAQMDYGT